MRFAAAFAGADEAVFFTKGCLVSGTTVIVLLKRGPDAVLLMGVEEESVFVLSAGAGRAGDGWFRGRLDIILTTILGLSWAEAVAAYIARIEGKTNKSVEI